MSEVESGRMRVAEEVSSALAGGGAVVALESTILAHGLPPGRNRKVAASVEDAVRAAGAVPATIAVLDGRLRVGLDGADLDRVCDPDADLAKLSARDLGPALALGRDGATTIASTTLIANAAGIGVFGTGGLGGVHLPAPGQTASWDVSADLDVLGSTPVAVVCSGVKSVLDIAATIEVLETRSVPVLGYRTDTFPAFYRRESRFGVPWRVDTPASAASVVAAHRSRGPGSGVLVVNPVPAEHELDADLHDRLLAEGMARVAASDVRGGDVTPVLLEHFHTASGGASLDANEALVLDNVRVAAEIAVELAAQRPV
ncbi:pseudouridine-5'-phosphate glycosidase [Actinophytocola gossypii]|uniref:Pseudouridine-5'-phosphate glycosidase n=1 Tax=Actinophytocola gossypii TaxID=2812003 RepID=A0ABT2J8V6_9PSEU|nr:pseudouridine-5'-phosphate glycosidase [Actinophytocola gossypii]MCT2583999.1 pseudouridine-5'-phosphate glycosidase [Actinophytocola gossypii]